MEVYVSSMLLSFGAGAIYAALAIGLVLTYRSSGVVNFAHGAIASYVAYTYSALVDEGDLLIPPLPNPFAPIEGIFGIEILDFPTFIDLGEGMGAFGALVVALLVAAVLGLVAHFFIFRALRYQPPLTKVVASIGLMLALQSALVIRFGGRAKPVDSLLSDSLTKESFKILGATIPKDRFAILAIILLVTAGLWLLFRFSRFGLHTRAAAENERYATLMGISADRQAAYNWMLASVLAGFVGVLVAPITSLTPVNYTLFIIPALAAALLAKFTSFWVAALGAVGLSMTQGVLQIMELKLEWMPDWNLREALPMLVIVVAMIARGQVLPTRGAVEVGRLPRAFPAPWKPKTAVFWIVVAASVIMFAPFEYRTGMTNTMVGAILALSLVVVTGYVGQISLAQISLAGISAAALATFATEMGIPFPIAPILAAVCATGVGLIVAIPSLRVRGASLAIVTLAGAVALEAIVFKGESWFRLEGNPNPRVDPPSLFGVEFGVNSPFFISDGDIPTPAFGLFVLLVLVVLSLGVMRLRQSRLGEQMLAVRANERAAAAAGINVNAVKLAAFGIASFIAGMGGAMTAYKLGTYKLVTFGVLINLAVLAFAYLGGISSVSGAIYAGTLFSQGIGVVVGERFIDLGRYEAYIAGILLIATAVFNPEGIDGFDRAQRARFIAWWKRRRAVPT